MLIKKFIAPTMPEALAKVKKELGEEAVILKTRMNRKAGGASEKGVEITAAIERDTQSRLNNVEVAKPETKPRITETISEESTAKQAVVPKVADSGIDDLKKQFDDLKKLVEEAEMYIEQNAAALERTSRSEQDLKPD